MITTNSCQEWQNARKFFNIENEPDLVLHHVDESLRKKDIQRYNEWRPEDLVVMTRAEHASFHHKGTTRKPCPEEKKRQISEKLTGRKIPEEVAEKAALGHCKKVMCVETGEIFSSVKEAKKQFPCIRRALKLGCATKGLHFIYYLEV